LDGTERGQEKVGRRDTNAPLESCRQIGGRKALAAEMSGQIAGTDEYDLLSLHPHYDSTGTPPHRRVD
jgi:hypothetical protein